MKAVWLVHYLLQVCDALGCLLTRNVDDTTGGRAQMQLLSLCGFQADDELQQAPQRDPNSDPSDARARRGIASREVEQLPGANSIDLKMRERTRRCAKLAQARRGDDAVLTTPSPR